MRPLLGAAVLLSARKTASLRDGGAARAILFTGAENRAAIAAYASLGFTPVGDYGLFLLAGG